MKTKTLSLIFAAALAAGAAGATPAGNEAHAHKHPTNQSHHGDRFDNPNSTGQQSGGQTNNGGRFSDTNQSGGNNGGQGYGN